MELSNYNKIADSLFRSEFSNTNIGYLENRLDNLELITRRGINVKEMLSLFKHGSPTSHHINDSTAKDIESELCLSEGWLDKKHEITPRKILGGIRQHNIARLVLSDNTKVDTKTFLSNILSSTPSMALYYLMYEISFEEQSFYFRALEKFLGIEICSLDEEML